MQEQWAALEPVKDLLPPTAPVSSDSNASTPRLPLLVMTGDEDPLFSPDYYEKHLAAPLQGLSAKVNVCLPCGRPVGRPASLCITGSIHPTRARARAHTHTRTHHAHTQVDSTWVRLPYGDHALCRYRSQVKTQTRPAGMHASSSMADDVSVAYTHTHKRALMPSCPHALIRAYRWCHGWSSLR